MYIAWYGISSFWLLLEIWFQELMIINWSKCSFTSWIGGLYTTATENEDTAVLMLMDVAWKSPRLGDNRIEFSIISTKVYGLLTMPYMTASTYMFGLEFADVFINRAQDSNYIPMCIFQTTMYELVCFNSIIIIR